MSPKEGLERAILFQKYIFLLLLTVGKTPNWQNMSLILDGLALFTLSPVVLVVVVFVLLVVLYHHSLHYFEASLKASGIEGGLLLVFDFDGSLIFFHSLSKWLKKILNKRKNTLVSSAI